MTTSEKPSSSSSSGSSFPPRAQRQRGCENHRENPQTFARRENKLQCSSGGTSSPGGIATTGEEWEGPTAAAAAARELVAARVDVDGGAGAGERGGRAARSPARQGEVPAACAAAARVMDARPPQSGAGLAPRDSGSAGEARGAAAPGDSASRGRGAAGVRSP
ncbi:unnamed protein product [Rangifer tarandus platyrhynchus]|uniref:Uncharacterized protein n=2 Tax=Rangifer tarandus platyrhynchus TaxID=3082113 RepID=A0ABN8ZAJ8_RANTA|nr:unnamed protein product [Rangifer tarandus platyrhynchus]